MELILIILVSISLLLNVCLMLGLWWQLRSNSKLDKYIEDRFNVYYQMKKNEELEEGDDEDVDF